jgi:hypothetical protein
MKKFLTLITVVIILSFCTNTPHNNVLIKTNGDTISSGNMFIAEIYVPYNQSISPVFYMTDRDTVRLPIDTIKKCAIFKALLEKEGMRRFEGYVDYVDLKGKKKTETFSFKYYVKSK